jgi:hypothetical protein
LIESKGLDLPAFFPVPGRNFNSLSMHQCERSVSGATRK